MRGTLHLLRADELPRYVGALARLRPRHHVPALAARTTASSASRPTRCSPRSRTRCAAAADARGARGAVAERAAEAALAEKLAGGFGDLLKPAAFTGDLCFAPSDGRLRALHAPGGLARRLGAARPGEEAAREVVRTYLRAYGPAPREQFQRWFGMTSPAEAGRWLEALGDEVDEVDVEGERGWMLAADVDEAAAARAGGRRPAAARRSTTTSSPRRATRRRSWPPSTARASTARRAGSRRCCSSTAGSRASGRTTRTATRSRSPSSRSRASDATCGRASRPRPSGSRAFLGGERRRRAGPDRDLMRSDPAARADYMHGMSVPPPSSPPPSASPRSPPAPRARARARERAAAQPRASERPAPAHRATACRSSTAACCRRRSSCRSAAVKVADRRRRARRSESGQVGRFPVLRRLGPTAVIPRTEGIEGWLWTSTGGTALTNLGERRRGAERRARVHQAARRGARCARRSTPSS